MTAGFDPEGTTLDVAGADGAIALLVECVRYPEQRPVTGAMWQAGGGKSSGLNRMIVLGARASCSLTGQGPALPVIGTE